MASLKSARQALQDLGYDPISALVEIAQNRNQLSELRVRAAIALLPYVYSQVPTKLDVSITENTGVMMVPIAVSEDHWQDQVNKIARLSLVKSDAPTDKLSVKDVEPDGSTH